MRPDVTIPGWTAPRWQERDDVDAAAARAVPAYLFVFGPATPEAFDAWRLRGATPTARLRAWFGGLGDALAAVEVEGRRCVAREQDVEDLAATRPDDVVRLLPAFDQFMLGPGTGDPHVVPPGHRSEVSRRAGWIAPVVVTADGMVGTWEPVTDGGQRGRHLGARDRRRTAGRHRVPGRPGAVGGPGGRAPASCADPGGGSDRQGDDALDRVRSSARHAARRVAKESTLDLPARSSNSIFTRPVDG